MGTRWWQREGHGRIICSFSPALLMSTCETWTMKQVHSKKKKNNKNKQAKPVWKYKNCCQNHQCPIVQRNR